MNLLDPLPRPRRVVVCGVQLDVHAITLGDLADLQAWVRDHSWNPFDVPPDVATPELLWACVAARGEGWPPAIHTDLAALSTEGSEYLTEWVHVVIGRKNNWERGMSATLAEFGPGDVLAWQDVLSSAYGDPPEHLAHRWMNRLEGEADKYQEPTDWALAIGAFCVDWKVMPWEAERLTLAQFRLFNAIRPDPETKHYVLDRPVRPNACRRDGESLRDARARRKALIAEGHAAVNAWEAARSGAGGPP